MTGSVNEAGQVLSAATITTGGVAVLANTGFSSIATVIAASVIILVGIIVASSSIKKLATRK